MSYKINPELLNLLLIEDKEYTSDELIQIMISKNQIYYNKKQGLKNVSNISDELSDFIGINHGDKISMVDAHEIIYKYIKDHNLYDGNIIHPDDKLSEILKYSKSIPLTYFNIHRYICCHFIF
jgi:chromatin remodeling complex protein RSC6